MCIYLMYELFQVITFSKNDEYKWNDKTFTTFHFIMHCLFLLGLLLLLLFLLSLLDNVLHICFYTN